MTTTKDTRAVIEPPLQGLAAYLRCEAGGVFVGHPAHATLMLWASEVDALTAGREALEQGEAVDCAYYSSRGSGHTVGAGGWILSCQRRTLQGL